MALVTRMQGSLKISGNEKPHETYKQHIKTHYRMSYRITQLEMNSYAYFSRAVIARCSPFYGKMGISSLESFPTTYVPAAKLSGLGLFLASLQQ